MTNDDIKKALDEIVHEHEAVSSTSSIARLAHNAALKEMRDAVEKWLTAPGGLVDERKAMTAYTADQPLKPSPWDYVLATKYDDGDPRDPWAVGFYGTEVTPGLHSVTDGAGRPIGRYRHVGRIPLDAGNWLLANAGLLERAPGKMNLWRMYDWEFENERILTGMYQLAGATTTCR